MTDKLKHVCFYCGERVDWLSDGFVVLGAKVPWMPRPCSRCELILIKGFVAHDGMGHIAEEANHPSRVLVCDKCGCSVSYDFNIRIGCGCRGEDGYGISGRIIERARGRRY
jgi:hypothetical protein